MNKPLPQLPEAVAKVYTCKCAVTKIEVQKPRKYKVDLRTITLEQAKELVELTGDRILVRKTKEADSAALPEKSK